MPAKLRVKLKSRYGKLVVLRRHGLGYECRCDCGRLAHPSSYKLLRDAEPKCWHCAMAAVAESRQAWNNWGRRKKQEVGT